MLQIQIGDLALQPHRQLLSGGERVTLGKRALDILSVLGEANGEIVTKEELFETVWPGVIVEENALQVHIVALRKALGREANRLETIRGIGYRLALEGHAVGEAIPKTNERRRVPTGRARFAGLRTPGKLGLAIAALAVVLAAAFIWTLRLQSEALRVQVVALDAEGGANAELLAGTLREDIVGMLSQSGVQTTDSGQSGLFPSSSEVGAVLKGSVVEAGGRLQVRVFLEDLPSGLTLWSGRYERPVDAADLLTDQVTAAATDMVLTLLETTQQQGFRLNPELTALYIRGHEQTGYTRFLSEGVPRKLFEQIVREAPQFAAGHGMLAGSLVGEVSRSAPADSAALLDRARSEIDMAIRIDPSAAGAAYFARFTSSFAGDKPISIKDAEDGLLDGLRHDPDFPWLVMLECRLLYDLGRVRDALPFCQRATALRPTNGPIGHSHVRALNISGQSELAKRAIDRAARFNPDHNMTRVVRLDLAAIYGSPDEAAALLHDPGTVPPVMNGEAIEAYDSFLLARSTGTPADVEKATAAVGALGRADARYLSFAVKALTSLGRIDEAFAVLRSRGPEGYPASEHLFEPVTAPLRADRRFWPVAARLGLVEYWTARNKWPDFCGKEMALAACKRAAARAI